jgi:hypothetical protein
MHTGGVECRAGAGHGRREGDGTGLGALRCGARPAHCASPPRRSAPPARGFVLRHSANPRASFESSVCQLLGFFIRTRGSPESYAYKGE